MILSHLFRIRNDRYGRGIPDWREVVPAGLPRLNHRPEQVMNDRYDNPGSNYIADETSRNVYLCIAGRCVLQ